MYILMIITIVQFTLVEFSKRVIFKFDLFIYEEITGYLGIWYVWYLTHLASAHTFLLVTDCFLRVAIKN